MCGKYIELINDSIFDPGDSNTEGDDHTDKVYISYDKNRKIILFRQFNIEEYINQFVLNDSVFVFETEVNENFSTGAKAKRSIKKISNDRIETIFSVSLPIKNMPVSE